jgi:hypothetical protein
MATKTTMAARAEQAAQLHQEGTKLLRRRPVSDFERIMNPTEGRRKLAEAEELMTVDPSAVIGSPATEMISAVAPDEVPTPLQEQFLDTLADPNAISIAASEARAGAASAAKVLAPALDAVQTSQASNSLERMLVHQLAAMHHLGMEMLARVVPGTMPPIEHARMMNAVARVFDTYANGCLVLQKLKSGGKQQVVVQYQQQVNVAPGGNAVVAGRVRPGSRRRGKGGQNAGGTS